MASVGSLSRFILTTPGNLLLVGRGLHAAGPGPWSMQRPHGFYLYTSALAPTQPFIQSHAGSQTPAKSDHVNVVTRLPPTTGSGCQQERPERPTRVNYLVILFHFPSFKNLTSKWESEGEKLPSI